MPQRKAKKGPDPDPASVVTAPVITSGPAKRKVVVVDDHPIVRERLAELINQEADLVVCAEAEDGPGAIAAVEAHMPDVAVIDITLKDTYGIDLVRQLKERRPTLPILVLSMHEESTYGERALRAGAKGYLNKQEASKKVVAALRQVLAGQIFVSEKMAAGLLQKVAGAGGGVQARTAEGGGAPVDVLTNREMEVFQLLGEGRSVRQIGEDLRISVKTVEAHREHIKQKLNLKSSNELLRYAIEANLLREA